MGRRDDSGIAHICWRQTLACYSPPNETHAESAKD